MTAFDTVSLADLYRSIAWAVVPTMIALVIFGVLWLRRRRGGQTLPSSQVEKTALGAFSGGIGADVNLFARLGQNAKPQETLGELTLRPNLGMRIYPVLLLVLLYGLVDQMYLSGPNADSVMIGPFDYGMIGLLLMFFLHSILYFNLYELRYDRDRFVHRSWFFQRREFDWSKLLMLRDDNGFFYVVHGSTQGKAYVPKFLIGVEDFVATVQMHIKRNDVH